MVNLFWLIKKLLPPILVDGMRYLKKYCNKEMPVWEYMPQGWHAARTDSRIKGWNVPGVLASYKAGWFDFVKTLKGTAPLDFYFSATTFSSTPKDDVTAHNTNMSYAYALLFAARVKSSISMLDWGGTLGHSFLLSRALVPDLQVEYHCKDLPLLVEQGSKFLPDAHFYMDESCFSRQYDFVLYSGSFQYSEDWVSMLCQAAKITGGYLFVTRLPVIYSASSYVMLQRPPYHYGYDTEYLGWCLNRNDFLKTAESAGLKLVREFYLGDHEAVLHAPEQPKIYGFLFSRAKVDRQ
jgi:putative methyltransferase (TIGR04325 family)